MAYLLVHFWPEATEENYRAEIAAVHPKEGLPIGQQYHVAGPSEGGFLIAAVWDSKEHMETFVQEILLPAQPVVGGFPNPVVERTAEVFNQQSA
ncbi:hypothetical protein IMCC26256_1136 [Actinobacteria bacterium IMCC26256]|nr:hypothetical protein IMCC26256_1136 [Actinobacteria bacterium IMCC26256]